MDEKKDEDSTMNEGEAAVAVAHAKRLVESGLNPSDIGIITPYAAQVQSLYLLLVYSRMACLPKLVINGVILPSVLLFASFSLTEFYSLQCFGKLTYELMLSSPVGNLS